MTDTAEAFQHRHHFRVGSPARSHGPAGALPRSEAAVGGVSHMVWFPSGLQEISAFRVNLSCGADAEARPSSPPHSHVRSCCVVQERRAARAHPSAGSIPKSSEESAAWRISLPMDRPLHLSNKDPKLLSPPSGQN